MRLNRNLLSNVSKYGPPLLALVLVVLVSFAFSFPNNVFAGTLSTRSDTLETSAFSVTSAHTFRFTTETALTTDGTSGADFSVVLNFPTNGGGDPFSIPGGLTTTDITGISLSSCSSQVVAVTAVELSSNGGAGADDEILIAFNETGQDSAPVPANCVFQFTVGGTNKITNPANGASGCIANAAGTADTCQIVVQTSENITGASPTIVDSGDVVVGLIEGVTVSATVDETLSFSMAQGGACAGDTGTPTSINANVTATTVPFGTIAPNTFRVGCQDYTVSTNGAGGYSVTSEENTNLRTSGGVNIPDTTCDSACSESSGTAWATASANQGLGYTCENITNTPCSTAGDTFTEYRQFACRGNNAQCDPGSGGETAQVSLTNTSPADGDVGRIHFKLSVSPIQGAGAYTNTVQNIATPIF